MTGPAADRFLCCFCGESIATTPRTITLEASGDGSQVWYAHPACLRERVHPLVKPTTVQGGVRRLAPLAARPFTWRRLVTTLVFWLILLLVPVLLIQLSSR
jgi:hypothetical protein